MADDRLLTTGDIAGYCGVHYRTVIRWIERGKLKAFQLPGRGDRRVKIPDFLRFLKENEIPLPPELIAPTPRALIVEDEPPMARAIQRVLRRLDYETRMAHDAFSAGAILADFHPLLVTLDLRMPGLGGTEVLRHIRENPLLHQTRILVVSAAPPDELELAVRSGAHAILEKPFDNDQLIQAIQSVLTLPSSEPLEEQP